MVTARAKFDKLRDQGLRGAVAAATLGVIQGYRAKRLYSRDVRRIVESIVGKPDRHPMTPMQSEIYRESRARAAAAAETAGKPSGKSDGNGKAKQPEPKRKAAS